ncbi:MAG: TonB-dependent receptor [Dokdonella sp.]
MNSHPIRRSRLCVALAAALLFSLPAMAQDTSSGVTGRVVDASGKPVANTPVEIIHVPSGTKSVSTTDANGRYQAQGLRVGGPYRVVPAGDDASAINDVYLRLAEVTTVNITEGAPSGATTLEGIVVTASPLLNTFSADNKGVGTNLSQRDLIAMPQPDRSIQNVVRADPRIVITDRDRGAFSASGQNFRYNSITVDTINAGDPFGLNDNGLPTKGTPISPDAIEEYNISVANYDVTTRRGVGATVNAVTKSGTNEFHGSAYYQYQDTDKMIGERDGAKYTGYTSKYTGGFTVGGPIVKDTLFFFLSYEEGKNKAPGSTFGPEGSGATNIVRNLTQAQVDQISAIAAGYGLDAGSTQASNVDLSTKRGLAKIDWNINDSHRASFRASRTEEDEPIITNSFTDLLKLSSNYYLVNKRNTSYALSLYDDWSDTFSTEASLGYNNFQQLRGPLNGTFSPDVTVRTNGTGSSAVEFGTELSSQANQLGVKTYNGYFAGNWFMGEHSIKAGIDFQRDEYYNLFLQRFNGAYEFDSIADFASGTYRRYRLAQPAPGFDLNNVAAVFDINQIGVFAQDTWQATDQLSIQYGLRYDVPKISTDPTANPCFSAAPGTLGNLGPCGLRAPSSSQSPNAARGGFGFSNQNTVDGNGVIQPRLSFNYAFDSERLTQLRGGAGLFISQAPSVWLANPYSNNGVAVAAYDVNRLRLPTDPAFSSNPFGQNIPGGALTVPGLGNSVQNVDSLDSNLRLPTVLKLSLGVDHELPWWGLVGTADFESINVNDAIQYQQLNLGTPTGTLPDGRLTYSRLPGAAPGSSNNTRYNANPSFGTVTYLTNTDKGGSNNLTLSVRKPFSENWSGTVGFTYSRATEVSPGTSSVANSNFSNRTYTNPNDAEVSISNYSIPRRAIASLSWSKNLFGDYASAASMFYDGHSGAPYSWVFGNDANGDSFSGQDLAFIPADLGSIGFAGLAQNNPALQQQFIDYIKQDNYLSDNQGRIFKRNSARAPWFNQIDVTLRQEIPGLFAGNKGEVRLDIFNFTNLLNNDWGVERRANFPLSRRLANFGGVDPQGRPIYNIDNQVRDGVYSPDALGVNESQNPSQRWSAQLTVRYKF